MGVQNKTHEEMILHWKGISDGSDNTVISHSFVAALSDTVNIILLGTMMLYSPQPA